VIKRIFDVSVSLLVLVALSPLLLLVALAVRFDSHGPVLFRHERVGRRFRRFQVLKFRTMVAGAPRMGGAVTVGGDPRITRIGHLLRRTKVDELPQFWNVLRGDMSIVGPRPEVPTYVERFRPDYEIILRVRPGITDPASLAYRHEAAVLARAADPEAAYVGQVLPAKLALAREYLRRPSLGRDLAIIWRTFLSLFDRRAQDTLP